MSLDDEMRACPGSCNRAWHRFWAGKQREEPSDPPVAGRPVWCVPCSSHIRHRLDGLTDQAALLDECDDGRLASPGKVDRVVHADATASPSPAYDQLDEVVQWACSWEDAYRQLLGDKPATLPSWTARRTRALSQAVGYLMHRFDTALAHPDVAADFGKELLKLTQRLERAVGADRLVHFLPMPCLRCERRALERRDGSETVECRACHRRWSWDDYRWLARAYAEGERERKRAQEAAG